jgi:large conductance mechanosensitive channel
MNKTLKEFREFIAGGNLIDVAVAFIMALYIKELVDSFIQGIVLRFVAAVVGKPDFSSIVLPLWNDKNLLIGSFITALINLVIVGAVMFAVIKAMNKMKKPTPDSPAILTEIELLTEIRDSLKK